MSKVITSTLLLCQMNSLVSGKQQKVRLCPFFLQLFIPLSCTFLICTITLLSYLFIWMLNLYIWLLPQDHCNSGGLVILQTHNDSDSGIIKCELRESGRGGLCKDVLVAGVAYVYVLHVMSYYCKRKMMGGGGRNGAKPNQNVFSVLFLIYLFVQFICHKILKLEHPDTAWCSKYWHSIVSMLHDKKHKGK